jgi:type VI secretion system protein ImpA
MDFSDLITPVSPEAPSGLDPEDYTANPALGLAYDQLDSLAGGELKDGVSVPPRWPAVLEAAHVLARQTKHLRIAVILTEGGCTTRGFPGLRDGLQLIRVWITGFWDSLYPALDRHLLLESLNHRRFLVTPRRAVLASAPGGSYSYDDFERAKDLGDDHADQEKANEARLILGAFADTPRETHVRNLTAVREALAECKAIEQFFDDKAGPDGGVNFGDLRDLLVKVSKVIQPFAEVGEAAVDGEAGAAGATGGGSRKALDGSVNSRQSAAAVLEKVALYFETAEPSSPVPYLVRRAQRCIGKSFMDLIDDLATDRQKAVDILSPPSKEETIPPKN